MSQERPTGPTMRELAGAIEMYALDYGLDAETIPVTAELLDELRRSGYLA